MSKPALTCGKRNGGWICERHPDLPWPHEACAGPGIPCDVVTCPYRVEFRPVTRRTGLGCPRCHQPVATIEDEGVDAVIFQCPRCAYRWSTDHAARKVH
jgi:hypothetical protein